MIWKYFYSTDSAEQHGTLYQLRNRLNRRNVVKKPKADFNACDDFIKVIIEGHIVVAALKTFKMKDIHDIPDESIITGASEMWMKTADERRDVLSKLCEMVVKDFVHIKFHQPDIKSGTDKISQYGKELLSLGCLYLEYSDAVKEGDGHRVYTCWKYLLPIFLNSNRTNYSNEVFNTLYQYECTFSPRLRCQLKWSRFVNVHGLPGKNVEADLHMEHINRIAKQSIRNLGANKTQKAIERVGRAVGTLDKVISNFDEENGIAKVSGAHKALKTEKDRTIVVGELLKAGVFESNQGVRKHRSHPNPRNLLHQGNKNVREWIATKIKQKST